MNNQVEFFFDFGSPYSYLAWHQLPKIAAKRAATIVWRPMLLGGVFQATGNHSPMEIPAKGRYSLIDLQRWAQHFGVPMTMNPHFPINTLTLMRGAVAMQGRSEAEFQRYLAAIFAAMFERPRNLGQAEEVTAVLHENGFDPVQFQRLFSDPAVKEQLKRNTEEAVARGVFGAPTFFVGEQMFWGQDRLAFVEQALT
jgi:2-hydroxychromene-2-carboxylate isomerase